MKSFARIGLVGDCNPQVNAQSLLESGHLRVMGVDENGDPRIVELDEHPIFLATLFQPELSAFQGVMHPLVVAFLNAAVNARKSKRPQVVNHTECQK